MTGKEILTCLTDRPCSVCKHHAEEGCTRWACVFEEEPDDAENNRNLISRMSLALASLQPTDNPRITEITILKDFEGMTNGEVIQALFPNCVLSIDEYGWRNTSIDGGTEFTPEWWNAPYQKGGE